jgi:hypothetical protein
LPLPLCLQQSPLLQRSSKSAPLKPPPPKQGINQTATTHNRTPTNNPTEHTNRRPQIFEELVKVGKKHELSAGLLIGGKKVKEEAIRVATINVLIATPGESLFL